MKQSQLGQQTQPAARRERESHAQKSTTFTASKPKKNSLVLGLVVRVFYIHV